MVKEESVNRLLQTLTSLNSNNLMVQLVNLSVVDSNTAMFSGWEIRLNRIQREVNRIATNLILPRMVSMEDNLRLPRLRQEEDRDLRVEGQAELQDSVNRWEWEE